MSLRTGVDITVFQQLGGPSSITNDQANIALDVGWGWVEDALNTHIIRTAESAEEHIFPLVMTDWARRDDRITLNKTRVTAITTVAVTREDNVCSCTTVDDTGCAYIIDGPSGIIAVRNCVNTAGQNCTQGCGSYKPLKVKITYTAGIYAAPPIASKLQLAVVMKAREVAQQITAGAVAELGAQNITSWRSMDYSETRKPPSNGSSYIDEYIRRHLLQEFYVKRAFSLRRTS